MSGATLLGFGAAAVLEKSAMRRLAEQRRQSFVESLKGGVEFEYAGDTYVFRKEVATLSAQDVQDPKKLKRACAIDDSSKHIAGHYLKNGDPHEIQSDSLPSALLEKLHAAMNGPDAKTFTPAETPAAAIKAR